MCLFKKLFFFKNDRKKSELHDATPPTHPSPHNVTKKNTANEMHLEENPSLSTETDQGKVWARKYLLVNYEITIIM